MRLTRIHSPIPLHAGQTLDLPAEAARHLVQVLRFVPGRELVLFDGSGRDFHARLTRADKRGAAAEVLTAGDPEPVLPLNLHLNLGISKGPRMDTAIQKAVELGVSAITPLVSAFGQVRLDGERLERRVEHWRGVVIAACEQSGRSRVPAVHGPLTLDERLDERVAADGLQGVVLEPGRVVPGASPRHPAGAPRAPRPAHRDRAPRRHRRHANPVGRLSMKIRAPVLLIAVAALAAGCVSAPERGATPYTLTLSAPIEIPAGTAHANFQGGGPTGAVNRFDLYCEFEVNRVGEQAQRIEPARFEVTRLEHRVVANELTGWPTTPMPLFDCGEEVHYETRMRLASPQQPDVRALICREAFSRCRVGRYPSMQAIEGALGPDFSIGF